MDSPIVTVALIAAASLLAAYAAHRAMLTVPAPEPHLPYGDGDMGAWTVGGRYGLRIVPRGARPFDWAVECPDLADPT